VQSIAQNGNMTRPPEKHNQNDLFRLAFDEAKICNLALKTTNQEHKSIN